MTKRKQRTHGTGNIELRHGAYFVRVRVDGVRYKFRLGRAEDFSSHKQIEAAAREAIARTSVSSVRNPRGVTLGEFIERTFLPAQKKLRRRSTYVEYEGIFQRHIKTLPESSRKLHQFRTYDIQSIIDSAAEEKLRSTTTLKHLKHYLGGVFKFAAQRDCFPRDWSNPVRDATIPKRTSKPNETVAYTTAEVNAVLDALDDDLEAKTIVAVAAFAGLRRSELQGLRWMDVDQDSINVAQTVWQSTVNPPKSRASANFVPVIPPLRAILEAYRAHCETTDQFGLLTPDSRMFRITLAKEGRNRLDIAFRRAGLRFSGYHAFRRGLASNLFELGLDDLTVMRVMRHGSVQVTRAHYIKVRDNRLAGAMDLLTAALEKGRARAAHGVSGATGTAEVVDRISTEAFIVR